MEPDLLSDRIDIFIGLMPDRKSDQLDYREFQLVPPVFACRSGHPLAQKPGLTIEDLVNHPYGGSNVPDWFLKQFVDAFPEHFVSISSLREIFLTTHELGLLRQLLAYTDIVGLVPEAVIHSELKSGAVQVLAKLDEIMTVNVTGVVVTREGRSLPPAATRLSALVLEMAQLGFRQSRQ